MSQIPSPYDSRAEERRAAVDSIVLIDRLFYVTPPREHGPLKETFQTLLRRLDEHVEQGTI